MAIIIAQMFYKSWDADWYSNIDSDITAPLPLRGASPHCSRRARDRWGKIAAALFEWDLEKNSPVPERGTGL
jgi:hypothetical protein